MRVRACGIAAVLVASGGLTPVVAAEPAGEAVAVIQAAAAEGGAGPRMLEPAGVVFMGDIVRTDENGQAQIRFRDDTRMVVGPNSQLTIDRFVYAGGGTAREVSLSAVRGAFRFITGNSAKSAYTITTPVATIGTRGTLFDVSILDDGTANLVFYGDGGVYYCDKQRPRRCTEITAACTLVVVTPDQEFRWITNVYERTAVMDELFPFAFRQVDLDEDFRVDSTGCDIRDTLSVPGGPGEPAAQPPPPPHREKDEEES